MCETPPQHIGHAVFAHFLASRVRGITTHQQVQPTVRLSVTGFSPFLPYPCLITSSTKAFGPIAG